MTVCPVEPGPPAQFDVVARGSTHFELKWTKPREENGILSGYQISYQTSKRNFYFDYEWTSAVYNFLLIC